MTDTGPDLKALLIDDGPEFAIKYLRPALDQAAKDGVTVPATVFGLLEMAAVILTAVDEDEALGYFEDYVRDFLEHWQEVRESRNPPLH